MKEPTITGLNTRFIPAENASNKILIVLHGLGDSADGFEFLPQFLGFSDLNYLLVNAPDSYFTGYSWFDIEANPEPGILRSRKLLLSLFEQITAQGISPGNIGLLGFSQGALMSLDAGLRFGERLGAIVAISGFVYFLEQLPAELGPRAKEVPVLATHGLFDPMLPIAHTKAQIAEMCKLGLDIRWEEYPKEHTIDSVKEAQDIRDFLKKKLHVGRS